MRGNDVSLISCTLQSALLSFARSKSVKRGLGIRSTATAPCQVASGRVRQRGVKVASAVGRARN